MLSCGPLDRTHAAARWAAVSVRPEWSARGLAVPAIAALLLPLAVLLPLASPWASLWLAPLFLLAAGLRLAALVNLALPPVPEPVPLADADLPSLTVLLPLYREAAVMPDLVAAMGRLDYPRHLVEFLVLLEADDPEQFSHDQDFARWLDASMSMYASRLASSNAASPAT